MSRFFDLLVANEVYADIDFITSPSEGNMTEVYQIGDSVSHLTIDWGDGTTTTASTTNTHTYTSAGDYRVRVLGDCSNVRYFYFTGNATNGNVTIVNNLSLPRMSIATRISFAQCTKLTRIRRMNVPNMQDGFYCFSNCKSLVSLPSNVTMSLTLAERMFYGCKSLTSLPDGISFANCTNINTAFLECTSLVSLPSGTTFANVTDAYRAFGDCSSLVWTPSASDFWERTSPQIKYCGRTFYGCTSLTNYSSIPTAWKDGGDTALYQPPNS